MGRLAVRATIVAALLTLALPAAAPRVSPAAGGGALHAVGSMAFAPMRARAAELPSAGSGLLGGGSFGTAGGVSGAAAPAAQAVDPVYNFGSTLGGPPIKHVFTIRNTGQAPLEIKNVVTSCGCTAAKPSKTVLAPGEIATIAASVDTSYEHGHSLSVVTVATNDPRNPALQLKLEGVIKPQVTAQPEDLDFGKVHHGTAAARDVELSDMVGGGGFALKSVKNSSPYVKVTSAARTDGKPGALLHVALSPAMPPGPISDTIEIETSRAPLRVAVLGVVTGDLTVEPAQVSFGIVPHHQGAVRIIRLANASQRAIKVLGVESTNHSVEARVDPVTPGKEYKVTLALRPNTPDGQIRGALTIKTDDPQQATLSVPYYGIVGAFKG